MQPVGNLSGREQLHFLFTNRIPRRFATRFMGRFSRIESKWLTSLSLAIWGLFSDDLDLAEARQREFRSIHECFTRRLAEGARPFDSREEVVCSPCDAIVGAMGAVEEATVYQAKGFPYELQDLLPDGDLCERYRDGVYVTLRLRSGMYHRFHAPVDSEIRQAIYISGDTWNVHPIALKRVEKLFCRNERVVLDLWRQGQPAGICLVAVAAILVASVRLECLEYPLDLSYAGPSVIPCGRCYGRGDELGYFEHGSTIILLAARGHALCEGVSSGQRIAAGQPLLTRPDRIECAA